MMRNFIRCCVALGLLFNLTYVHADAHLIYHKPVQIFIRDMVKHHHFDKRQLIAILQEAKYQPQIIASMERPYEKKPWDVYKELFLTPERLQSGLNFWQANQQALQDAERRFGVPADIIVAILGVETLYGKHQGNYRVLDALATLAFYYPKRADFFTKELKEYLLLCREHGVSATKYLGSYAGAMGKPQFMPSSYRFYAVNSRGQGRPNLISEDSDVIHSVANYFSKHGWKRYGMVAEPVLIQGTAYKLLTTNSKIPNYTLGDLIQAGVKPEIAHTSRSQQVGLIELDRRTGDQEFWLAYPNFYVITRYNTSPQYALVVYLLSQQLRARWADLHSMKPFQGASHKKLLG